MIGRAAIVALSLAACAAPLSARGEAELQLARGDVRGAIARLEAHVASAPDDVAAWLTLGHAYELAHRFEDASASYDRAAYVAPHDPRGPREGGRRHAAWGDGDGAIERLREAVRRGDDDPETFHALGVALLARGDRDGAEAAYRAGLATAGGARDATCVLGLATVAVARDDAAAALRWYDELLVRRPASGASAHLGRAWALGRLGRSADARRALELAAVAGAQPRDVERLRAWIDRGAP